MISKELAKLVELFELAMDVTKAEGMVEFGVKESMSGFGDGSYCRKESCKLGECEQFAGVGVQHVVVGCIG